MLRPPGEDGLPLAQLAAAGPAVAGLLGATRSTCGAGREGQATWQKGSGDVKSLGQSPRHDVKIC